MNFCCRNSSPIKKQYWVYGCSAFWLIFALILGVLWSSLSVQILYSVSHKQVIFINLTKEFNFCDIKLYIVINTSRWFNDLFKLDGTTDTNSFRNLFV